MHFRALVYYCLHVVHSALWSRMWSKLVPQKFKCGHLKIGRYIRRAVAAVSRNAEEQNTVWSARKQPTEICGHTEPKPRGQAMWSKAIAKSKWIWYNEYADIAKRPSRRAYNPEALVWLQLPLYRFNNENQPLRAGKQTPTSRAFFFRRCRIVTWKNKFVKS